MTDYSDYTIQDNIFNSRAALDKCFRNLARQKATIAATEAQIAILSAHLRELEQADKKNKK